MDLGKFSVSLAVKDLATSRAFYEKLGFRQIDGNEEQNWLILRSGDVVIGLFQGLFEKNLLTFNPDDVRSIQKTLEANGVELIEKAQGDEGPAHITMVDPDDNPILFDQHDTKHRPSVEQPPGRLAWLDLTVPNADEVKDFYAAVVGWEPEAVSLGDYDDYNMHFAGKPVAGICNKRDGNAHVPSQWMAYFTVNDIDESLANVTKHGGEVVSDPRGSAGNRYAIVRDPGGAVCTIHEGR